MKTHFLFSECVAKKTKRIKVKPLRYYEKYTKEQSFGVYTPHLPSLYPNLVFMGSLGLLKLLSHLYLWNPRGTQEWTHIRTHRTHRVLLLSYWILLIRVIFSWLVNTPPWRLKTGRALRTMTITRVLLDAYWQIWSSFVCRFSETKSVKARTLWTAEALGVNMGEKTATGTNCEVKTSGREPVAQALGNTRNYKGASEGRKSLFTPFGHSGSFYSGLVGVENKLGVVTQR